MDFSEKELEKYIGGASSPEDPLLAELDRETNLRAIQPRMISGHIQGRFLEMLVRLIRPRDILEIGTFTGYSTLCMAAGIEAGGTIDTIEIDDELQDISSSFFERSPHGDRIVQHIGSALEVAPGLGKVYDMVFIDGDKREYPDYYKMIMGDGGMSRNSRPLVRPGSVILADNVLWYGKVAGDAHSDPHTSGIKEFNRMVNGDARVENVILPLRDGINMIRVL